MSRLFVFLLLAVAALPASAQSTNAERDARVAKILPALARASREFARGFRSPGMAIAVVTPDRTYYITYGVREAGRPGRVNTRTIFQLASVSKPITSTFAAALVSQGKLDWDESVRELLPKFRFASAEITRRTTVRDMLWQISGLPGETGDFLETLGFGEQDILHRMRLVSTGPDFQRKWAYTNFGVTTGGLAAAAAAGKPFDRAISENLFRPAGMSTAFISYRRLAQTRNRASLHTTVLGPPLPLFIRDAQPETPGGGINGSVRDMAAFLRLHLNEGRAGGRQLISPEVLREAYQPSDVNPKYALCWNVEMGEDGEPERINHSGAFYPGARTEVGFWRKEKVGIAVLTNSFPSLLPEAVSDAFYSLYTTGRVRPGTLRRFKHLVPVAFPDFNRKKEQRRLVGSVDVAGDIGGVPLSAYAGVYRNDYVGRVQVQLAPDPATGVPTLFFVVGQRFGPVKIQQIAGTSDLISTTVEGDPIQYEFHDPQGGFFQELRLPALKEIGWDKLRRVP